MRSLLFLLALASSGKADTLLDNTDELSPATIGSQAVVLQANRTYAVSFYFVEGDSSCGPGAYALSSLALALSQISEGPDAAVSVTLGLFSADSSGVPIDRQYFGSSLQTVSGRSAPSYVSMTLPASFALDISDDPTARYAVSFKPSVSVSLSSLALAIQEGARS
jgi:hypothetical protein